MTEYPTDDDYTIKKTKAGHMVISPAGVVTGPYVDYDEAEQAVGRLTPPTNQ